MGNSSYSPLDEMRSAIQLAGFHYIACLKTTPSNLDSQITIGDKEHIFENIRTTDSVILHSEFQMWAARTVLRDLIENFSIFLTRGYSDAIEANKGAPYPTTLEQFERKGIDDQINVISENFFIDSEWVARIVGFNKARNCLAHRQGLVSQRDVTDGNTLVVRWIVMNIELSSGPTQPFVEATGLMSSLVRTEHIHGSAINFSIKERKKSADIGSVLILLPTEILEICQTFQMLSGAFDVRSLTRR